MKVTGNAKPPATVTYGLVSSPVGKLVIGLDDKNQICRLAFLRKRKIAEVLAEWRHEWPKTNFAGGAKLTHFDKRPIALTGTKFQHSVWRVMAKIPSGSVTTYGEIAHAIGNPKAARAVGAACGANPVPFLIPCHRVIAGDGSLGGFSSGLDVKEKLLKVEGWLK